MTDNDFEKKQAEEKKPEDFRPIIPEPEIHRRPIIGFNKNYPVEENPTSTHTESFAQQEFKRKVRRNIIYTLVLILTFVTAFIITDTCIKISKEPIATTTPAVTHTTTAVSIVPATEAPSETVSEEAL